MSIFVRFMQILCAHTKCAREQTLQRLSSANHLLNVNVTCAWLDHTAAGDGNRGSSRGFAKFSFSVEEISVGSVRSMQWLMATPSRSAGERIISLISFNKMTKLVKILVRMPFESENEYDNGNDITAAATASAAAALNARMKPKSMWRRHLDACIRRNPTMTSAYFELKRVNSPVSILIDISIEISSPHE